MIVCESAAIGFSIAVITLGWTIYKPLLDMYSEGCVKELVLESGQAVQVGTGTILTDNVYAMAFNFASFQGNRESSCLPETPLIHVISGSSESNDKFSTWIPMFLLMIFLMVSTAFL